ncbi:BamA/TamA family outer membrane protein [bacterium]|nr:BamA/TamA family outer membrane protein [bacterium]
MNKFRLPRFTTILTAMALISALLAIPTHAQGSEDTSIREDVATQDMGTEEELQAGDVEISEDITPIGIVDEIILTGEIVTSRHAVLRQMTFRVGDDISRRDIDLCRRRLLAFNGIYWLADITWEPAEEENHIIITVDLHSRRTWFISPAQTGGLISDRNFLGTADSLTFTAFISGPDNYYYSLGWGDPQLFGGHNSLYVEAHVISTSNTIRTDTLITTGESYFIDRHGFNLNYRTRWNETISVALGYKFDDVTTQKAGDPFRGFGTDYHYFYSGTDIPRGNVGVFSFGLSKGVLDSIYFPTVGYYWNFNNEISNSVFLSDFSFTRHRITAAYFYDLHKARNVLCGKFSYAYLTGDPPYYELLPFDWQVRGYTLSSQRGKSMMAMNFEYRFIAEPEIFQGVIFADFGRAWDGHGFSFNDLEWGYGIGLRIYTLPFIPYNLLLRIDYGRGEYGDEVLFTFNQFF